MPNTLNVPARPVVLTGFDLEIRCRRCGQLQVVGDDQVSPATADEYVALHALPGRYLLDYRVMCWTCGDVISGTLTIRSRAVPGA